MSVAPSDIAQNHLLVRLPAAAIAALRPHFERVDMRLHGRLSLADKPIRHAYFPGAGMISLVQAFGDGSVTEVGLVGCEGFWGTPLILGARSSPVEAMVQGEGWALRIAASDLLAVSAGVPAVMTLLLRYAQFLHVQVAVTAACNGRHNVSQRLSRWLLEASDRLGATTVPLTHEFLSYMLGVRRAGVTDALNVLKETDIVSIGRNKVIVRDRPALEAEACECYRLVKAESRRLLPGSPKASRAAPAVRAAEVPR